MDCPYDLFPWSVETQGMVHSFRTCYYSFGQRFPYFRIVDIAALLPEALAVYPRLHLPPVFLRGDVPALGLVGRKIQE